MRKVLFFFGQLSDEDTEWLTEVGRARAVQAGAELIREGEPAPAIYVLLEGVLSVVSRRTGKDLAQLRTGEIVGEMSFVDTRPPSATVRALSACVVLEVAKELLSERIEDDPGFGLRFYRALAVYLSHQVRHSNQLIGLGASPTQLDAAIEDDLDELDASVLDQLHLAGARFEQLCARALSKRGSRAYELNRTP